MGKVDIQTEAAPVAVRSVVDGGAPADFVLEQRESQDLKSAFALTTVTPDNTGMGDIGVHENQVSDGVNGADMSSLNAKHSTSSVLQKNLKFEEGTQYAQDAKRAASNMVSDQLLDGDLIYAQKLGSEHSDSLSSDMLKGIGCAEGRQHHLLRHSLPNEQRGMSVLTHFGVETVSDAAKSIKKMSQRDLQAKFRSVYGTKTFSNNNNWLRRKLFEAIGLDPGKSNTKKSNVGGQRRRRVSKPAPAKAPSRFSRRTRAEIDADHQSVAEALLALADIAHMEEENGACSDGIVPAACRDDVSEGGLSWSSRGISRDVPVAVPSKEELAAPIAEPSAKLKEEEPKCANELPNVFEYYAMAQRHAMQNPEVQAAMMAMMNQQIPPNAEQLQVLQQVQQAQHYAMMMYMQANPSVMQTILSQNMLHPMMSEVHSRMQGDWSPQNQYFNPALVPGVSSPAYQDFTFASPGNVEQKFS